MWITNKLGYDITLSGVTLYKNSQQEISSADATKLNNDAVFTAMITAGTGLVKTDSQPDVNPQYFVRPLDAPVTLDGMPTNPNGHPMVSPAQAFDIGKAEGSDVDLETNHEAEVNIRNILINEVQETEIIPAEGKDGMKKVTLQFSRSGVENNKEATIDVSSYTTPVRIVPSVDNAVMKEATVTLTGLEDRGKLSAWKNATDNSILYCNFDSLEGETDNFVYTKRCASVDNGTIITASTVFDYFNSKGFGIGGAFIINDNKFDLLLNEISTGTETTVTYNRSSVDDVVLW